ncbi:MAG: hypothetical protein NC206_08195 [Bacteroides sp.]|nr:hypothetical protein [Roseburia sp.]MCM1347049.1 hypothetical protein [Bacteroides sp.]MCM1421731.1 hypothetical protein [Bacteroides sp.]
MSRKVIFRWLYYLLAVLWLVQVVVAGFNIYLLVPTLCLVVCYYLQKQ